MKALVLPQPWAGAAVLGHTEVVNLPRKPRISGTVLVYARGVDRRVLGERHARNMLGNALGHEQDTMLGTIDVGGVSQPDECQLRLAAGPWCVVIRDPRVFLDPVPWPRLTGPVADVEPDAEVELALADALGADEWLRLHNRQRMEKPTPEHPGDAPPPEEGPDPYEREPPSRDGWRGD